MAPLVDSHCHLNSIELSAFGDDLAQVLALARARGVEHILSVCVEPSDVPELYHIASTYPDISISVGVHPTTEMSEEWDVQGLIERSNHPACIAIGETGLDYYRAELESTREIQRNRFRAHIQASRQTSKPLIIHTRQAAEDTLQLLKEEQADTIGGVMHCFSEDWSVAKRALDLNFYISLSGIVTFKNADMLRAVAQKVPRDRILIETDAPYLAPVPFRGKQNHPALVAYVAETLSDLLQMDYEALAHQTTENFYRCFRIQRTAS